MKADLPLMKGNKVVDNADYRDALPVNLTIVVEPIRGAQGYLLSHAGLTAHATGLGLDRGGYWNERQGKHFRVSGENLISVSTAGSINNIGEITGLDRASMTHSFNTQAIVADGKMWLYNGATLNQVTDNDLGNPIDITWIDGYYFLTDGEYIYHTDILDESSIDPLKFATSEFSPDPTLAVDKTSDNQVIVFNRYSTEYFANTANDNFAFTRIQSKAVKCGVVGTGCETEMEGIFYVMGGGREESVSIHYISAGTYQSIASRSVDQIIASYSEDELQDAVLETRVTERDKFIIVRLPNHTLLYNKSVADIYGNAQAWTTVKSEITNDGPWRGVNGVSVPNVGWVYGDLNTTKIGVLDSSVATQYGEQVETIMYTPLVDMDDASINELEIDILPGHQVSSEDTISFISLTYDGLTFGKEWSLSYGVKGNYINRFIANRLGYIRDFVGFKVRTVSSGRVAFSRCSLDYG